MKIKMATRTKSKNGFYQASQNQLTETDDIMIEIIIWKQGNILSSKSFCVYVCVVGGGGG